MRNPEHADYVNNVEVGVTKKYDATDFSRGCQVLTRSCYRDQWPGFRTVLGSRPSHRTPLSGLYNVGDGVSPPGYEGSMGAAKSAREVFADVS
ncbi:MAG: hypothetical protein Cons2KO_10320 [Congregibacter sp.]